MTIQEWADTARTECLRDAFEFLHAKGLCQTVEEMDALAGEWPRHIAELFDPNAPHAFYTRWTGRVGASNIPVNICDQFSRAYVIAALAHLFTPPYAFGGKMLDFGCGSAAVSLSWQRAFAPRARLYLADVDNLPREFVGYRLERRGDTNVSMVDVGLADVPDNSVDLIVCIDVFEHLCDPSEKLRLLHRKLRSGGIFLVQATWGGHPEHLDVAPVDWEAGGGSQLLETQYLPLFKMVDGMPVSGAYWKKLGG